MAVFVRYAPNKYINLETIDGIQVEGGSTLILMADQSAQVRGGDLKPGFTVDDVARYLGQLIDLTQFYKPPPKDSEGEPPVQ